MKTKFNPDNEDAALTAPTGAEQKGMRELVRLWFYNEPTLRKRLFSINIRTEFSSLSAWMEPILGIIRTVIKDINLGRPPLTPAELDQETFNFLDSISDHLISMGVETGYELDEPMNPNRTAMPDVHPGLLSIPEEAQDDPEFKQVVTVWHLPERQNCPGCGEDHEESLILSGDSSLVSTDKFGELLASMTVAHANDTAKTDRDRLMMIADIQKKFHEALTVGLPKA